MRNLGLKMDYEEPDSIRAIRPQHGDEGIFWFRDDLHNPYPVSSLGMSTVHRGHMWGYATAAEEAKLPSSRGAIVKTHNQRVYLGFVGIEDPEEIEKRFGEFVSFVELNINNWEEFYGRIIAEGKKITWPNVQKDLTVLSNGDLLDHFRKTVRATFRCWYLHFRGMYVSTSVYLQGEEFIKNRGLSEQGFTNMLTGHETKGQLTDRGQYQLCRLAYEIPAVKELLLGADDIAIVVETLKTSEKCSQWYQQFNAYLSEFGHRLTAAILDVNFPTWCEDPTPVIDNIRSMMPKMAAGWDYDQELGKMHLKRDKVIAQARGQLSEEDRAAFDEQLPNWQKAYAYNEDHWFYLEQVCFSAIRYAALEIGRRLAEANIIEDPQDVFHLTDYEIYEVMESLAEAKGPARYIYSHLLGPLVKHRKELYEKAGNLKEAPFLGNVPETVEDPIAMKVFGLTNFILDKARQETTGKTVKAEEVLEGFPGAPGLVKGKAKVITSHKDFPKVQPDDILVCPYTSPAWTSIFPKVAAVVTDSGGMLTHAAIMAREYGVPAVVGTWVATETIKTGDTIIVDGNKGRVEIVR